MGKACEERQDKRRLEFKKRYFFWPRQALQGYFCFWGAGAVGMRLAGEQNHGPSGAGIPSTKA